ncbi:hypothetical protein ACHAXR_004555 [Thalassiosira sp. AJA248-18]
MATRLARSIASRLACIPNPNREAQQLLPPIANVSKKRSSDVHAVSGGGAINFSTTTNAGKAGSEHVNGCSTPDAAHEVTVTQSRSSDTITKPFLHNKNNSMELVDNLLLRTSEMMDPHAANVVAYSGGVDSSLVAALVYRAYSDYNHPILQPPSTFTSTITINGSKNHNNNHQGSVQAVLGISPAVPQTQISMARIVAKSIGIPLTEVSTTEGSDETYQRNDGYACYVCKTHLYSTLETVANTVLKQQQERQYVDGGGMQQQKQQKNNHPVILFNGTNADDTQDPTRLGLIAASNFQVHSPLDQITKDQVRQAAKYLGLPNWNAAASPCLRSRLAMGVTATEDHLRAVELAEEFVRRVLELDETVNARVRMLAGGKAMVELDNSILLEKTTTGGNNNNWATSLLQEHGFEERCIDEWGFNSFGGVRGFKTGSVAAMPTEESQQPLASTAL